jgi:hypothetical protein
VKTWRMGCCSKGRAQKCETESVEEELRGWGMARTVGQLAPWSNIDTGRRSGLYGRRNKKAGGDARELNG